jgi:hypothetical protein
VVKVIMPTPVAKGMLPFLLDAFFSFLPVHSEVIPTCFYGGGVLIEHDMMYELLEWGYSPSLDASTNES